MQAIKLVLFDAERRVFAIKGELPLSPDGDPLENTVYRDFFIHWLPKVMEAYFNNKDKTVTGKVTLDLNLL